jgi:hypothetical protein
MGTLRVEQVCKVPSLPLLQVKLIATIRLVVWLGLITQTVRLKKKEEKQQESWMPKCQTSLK